MAKEWMISLRLEDTPENRDRVARLQRHAFLKFGKQPGGMKKDTPSEFLRFAINYYQSREIQGR